MLQKLRRNKKGQTVLPLTIALAVFSLFYYILVMAFANDDIFIAQASNVYDMDVNATGSDVDTADAVFETYNWFERFWITAIYGVPWWINAIIGFINGILLILIVAGWIRGV